MNHPSNSPSELLKRIERLERELSDAKDELEFLKAAQKANTELRKEVTVKRRTL